MAKTEKLSYTESKKKRMLAKADEWQSRLAGVLVVLIMCVQPLYINWERYNRLTWHKFVFFIAYMVCALVAVAIIWVYRVTRKPALLPRDKLTIVDWVVLSFAAVTLISALFSPFRGVADVWAGAAERYDGAITQLLYVAVYFIVSRWYVPKTRHFMLFGISAILIAIIGILQFYGMDFLKLWPNNVPEYHAPNFYNIFFRTTIGNVDFVSTYTCIAVLLCGFLFIRMKSKWQPLWLAASALSFWMMDLGNADSGRVGVIAATFLALPFIIETMKILGRTLILLSSWLAVYTLQKLIFEALILKTRTAGSLLLFIAVVIVLLIAGFILTRFGKERGDNAPAKWKLGVILIVACIVTGLIGVEVLGSRAARQENPNRLLVEARGVLHGNIRDEMGTNRVYIWRNALQVFPDHPIIGSGPDTFHNAFPEEAQMFYGSEYDKAHNEYIQILICQGILGLLCYLAFIALVLRKAVPKAFGNPLVMAVLAAFAGYCVQAFFNISVPISSQMLWVFAGMLTSKRVGEATNAIVT